MPTSLMIIGPVFAFLYGIVVGSFLNVCIYRLPAGESLIHPPSHCPRCNTRLRSQDLVPLFSFLLLGGKCRYCKAPISWRYFTIEFITGLLFAACWFALAVRYGENIWTAPVLLLLALSWLFASAMLVTFMIDLDTTYVIEPVTWLAMAAGLGFELVTKWIDKQPIVYSIGGMDIPYLPTAIPGMVLGFLVFVAMDLFGRLIFRKPSMGLGDAFIGAAIGAMLGPQLALLSFGIAVFSCVVIAIPLMIAGSLKRSKAPDLEEPPAKPEAEGGEEEMPEGFYLPFGPFLTASAMLVVLLPKWVPLQAAHLWSWWMSLLT